MTPVTLRMTSTNTNTKHRNTMMTETRDPGTTGENHLIQGQLRGGILIETITKTRKETEDIHLTVDMMQTDSHVRLAMKKQDMHDTMTCMMRDILAMINTMTGDLKTNTGMKRDMETGQLRNLDLIVILTMIEELIETQETGEDTIAQRINTLVKREGLTTVVIPQVILIEEGKNIKLVTDGLCNDVLHFSPNVLHMKTILIF